MRRVVKFGDTKYYSDEFNRTTSASPHGPGTVIKYITPRVVPTNISSSFYGYPRGVAWSNVGSGYPTATPTSLGLASLVQREMLTTTSALHSIDGERIIDEHRELARITEILGNTILACCNYEAHNRAQELQIEWLITHSKENGLTIEKMFLSEIESAKSIVHDSSRNKPAAEQKINEIKKKTSALDQQYQQLLSKRNSLSKELFDYERKIAQNAAEAQLLNRRISHLDDQTKFYILKNQNIQARRVRLRYELDEELFSYQSLKLELEILKKEKITNEDVRRAALEDIKNSVNKSQLASIQPSQYFCDQLNHEVQRIRDGFEKKMEIHREELHRTYELELHRYHISKVHVGSIGTNELQAELERYQFQKNAVAQEIACLRGRINELFIQIGTMENQISSGNSGRQSTSSPKQRLASLNQLIQQRERDRDKLLHARTTFKQQIENYKQRLERYSRKKTQNYYDKRSSLQDIRRSYRSPTSPNSKSSTRYSLQDIPDEYPRAITRRSPPPTARSHSPYCAKHSPVTQIGELGEQGTLIKYAGFNVDQDCDQLHRLLHTSYIDEIAIMRILCNRSLDQRIQIRDRYKNTYNSDLGADLDVITNDSLSKLLRLLLMTSVQLDCFELRRVLKKSNLDENILAEIFFGRSQKHIQIVRETYQKLFRNSLEHDITGGRDSQSKRIFVALLRSNRPESDRIDDDEILKDARDLHETGTRWKTDGSTFLRLLCTRSNAQLKQIFAVYQQLNNTDIEQTIKVNMEGSLYCAFMAIVRIIRNRPRFFAYGLQKNLKGAATNEDNLNRIIVARCEIDTVQIKNEYEQITKRTLYDHIQSDISGNYKRALLELLRQRIELSTIELTLRQSNDPARLSQNKNTDGQPVQWREPTTKVSANVFVNGSLVRTVGDSSANRRGQIDDDPFDRDYLVRRSSSPPPGPKSPKSQYLNRRSFVPMRTTYENQSQNGDDDEE